MKTERNEHRVDASADVTLGQRLRYRLDNRLAKGPGSLIGLLAIVALGVVLLAGFLLWVGNVNVNGEGAEGLEGFWASLMRTLDPGTMGGDRGWRFRLTSLVVTVAGIFIVSTLIGLLANGIGARLDELRRGRSRVIETGHTLLLGWSPKVFILLEELSASAAPGECPCVVVLADRDMVEMEEQFRLAFRDSLAVRLVTRTGDPSSPRELLGVSPLQARSVVVLKEESGSDASTVRTVLALAHLGLDPTVPVVIELDDGRRTNALAMASSLRILPVVSRDWVAMVTARAVQFPSMAQIYEELLNFDGAEVYFTDVPKALVGRTVHEAVEAVRGGAVFGVRRSGNVLIAPLPDFTLAQGDEFVLVAGQRTDLAFADAGLSRSVSERSDSLALPEPARAHVLILGWNDLGDRVLQILDQSIVAGSLIDVVVPEQTKVGASLPSFQRLTVREIAGEITDASLLERILSDSSVTQVLVLSSRSPSGAMSSDADALLAVLELRHLLASRPDVRVTVEIGDPVNVDLIQRDSREEFIVGERLVCLLMSQMSQTFGVLDVLRSLMSEDDSDIALLPAAGLLGGRASMSGPDAARRLRDVGRYLVGAGTNGRLRLQPNLAGLTITPDMDLVVIHNSNFEVTGSPVASM